MMRVRGQTMPQLMFAFAILVPLLLVLLDLGSLWYDTHANDELCKNAARAAAAGDPGSARQRAQSVIDLKNQTGKGPLVKRFVLVQCVEMSGAAGSQPGGSESKGTEPAAMASTGQGAMEVTTEVQIKPMLVHFALGGTLPMTVRSVQSSFITTAQPAP